MNGEPDGSDSAEQGHGYQYREEKEKPEKTPKAIAHIHGRGFYHEGASLSSCSSFLLEKQL
jgi:hypothetical protein